MGQHCCPNTIILQGIAKAFVGRSIHQTFKLTHVGHFYLHKPSPGFGFTVDHFRRIGECFIDRNNFTGNGAKTSLAALPIPRQRHPRLFQHSGQLPGHPQTRHHPIALRVIGDADGSDVAFHCNPFMVFGK